MPAEASSPVAAAPSVVSGENSSRWKRVLIGTAAVAGVAGWMWLTAGGPAHEKEEPRPPPPEVPGQIGAPFDPGARPALRNAGLPVPGVTTAAPQPAPAYAPAPLMAFGAEPMRQVARPGGPPDPNAVQAAATGEADPLSRRLSAEDQPTAVAYRLPDRNLFLTEGTPIPCVPDAPITSDVAGSFRCRVPEPGVLSDSGNVTLIDGGAWISGRVGEGLRRGQRRLFVTFTKISSKGCEVRIRAPGADALGQAGLDGEIDNKFMQRFGAYIGMAFLDGAMQAAVLAASNAAGRNGSLNFYQFQNAGRQGGRDIFAEDASVPSTLYRNQAEPVVVRITQDVDMRPCYRLRMREGVR